ncbi:hypothetical protein [Roseibium sp.]|uniref:hypothetical protein n=1 Tax=Roseibium sp. TaxID=1936156 RepID=UPI003BA8BD04
MYTFSGVEDLAVFLIKTELSLRNERDIGFFRVIDENGPPQAADLPVKFPDARQHARPRDGETAASPVFRCYIQAV